MSAATPTADPQPQATAVATVRRWMRDEPIIPLIGLLIVLVVVLQLVRPGIVTVDWVSTTIKFATPLAILAACQTLCMLTGGIDLSVGANATLAAFLAATLASSQGDGTAILIGLAAAMIVGLGNGVGVALFRVQPLIMTLGTGLVVAGFLTVYQTVAVASASSVPAVIADLFGGTSFSVIPNSLYIFLPLAVIIILGLRRSGFGRLLYAVGDNARASRLAGVRIWQVLLVVYVLSGFLAGIAGLAFSGVAKGATINLVDVYVLPSVAAVVIGGTSIFGGRGGYAGSIVGALILTVLVAILTVLQAPQPVRQILFGLIILAVAAAYTRFTGEG